MDFSKISLDTPVEDMDEAGLRATLSDVMAAHEANYAEAEAQEKQFSELTEDLEAAEAQVEEAKSAFATKAADYTNIDTDTLVDRFSMEELVSFAEDAEDGEAEFSEEESEDSEEAEFSEEEGEETEEVEFSEKPPKAPEIPEGGADYSEKAASRLDRVPGLVLE